MKSRFTGIMFSDFSMFFFLLLFFNFYFYFLSKASYHGRNRLLLESLPYLGGGEMFNQEKIRGQRGTIYL